MRTSSGFGAIALAAITCVLGTAAPLGADPRIPEVVYPSFENSLRVATDNPPSDICSSVAFFTGSTGAYCPPGTGDAPVVPQAADSGIQLAGSAFGQVFAPRLAPEFLDEILIAAQDMLYPSPAVPGAVMTRAQVEGSGAAFRYKPLLFSPGEGGIRIDLTSFGEWYGDAERTRAREAIQILRSVLQQDPLSTKARNTLLDAYYDFAVAEMQLIKLMQGELAAYRLGFQLPPPGGFVIDEEIALHEEMMAAYERILGSYGDLLGDRMGVHTATVDAAAVPGLPLGAYVFIEEQPARSQLASQFRDDDGVLKTVPDYDSGTGTTGAPSNDERILFAAYKDYVTILAVFRNYAQTASDLARLHAMRGRRGSQPEDNDRGLAYALINRVQQEIQTTMVLLDGFFPDLAPDPGDASGLATARNGVQVSLADLSHARSFLDGDSNILGFDPDFLVLIQEFPDSTQGNQFDSYDALVRWIRNTATSPLEFARTAYDRAFANYSSYQGFADQVDRELSDIGSTYARRYWEITGYNPDEAGEHLDEPRPGSALWEANQNIAHADEAVATLRALADLGYQHAEAAAKTLEKGNARISAIESQYVSYTSDITDQRDIITHWSAAQAGAQAAYDTISDMASLSADNLILSGSGSAWAIGISGAVNAAIQTAGEEFKGNAQKQLDLAGAEWEFTTELADAELVVAQAQDAQHDLARERMSTALKASDTRKMQAQEIANRANLLREVQSIQQIRAECETGVSGRYYADPIHFLRARNDMIQADLAFREAQRWVFFSTRALEFKWNRDFVIRHLGKDWEKSTLFALRNYRELEEMVAALEQFNTINLVGFNREPFVDRISLRDHVLARHPGPGADDGWRIDLQTGDRVTAAELLRRKLKRGRDTDGNLVIRLNTFALELSDGLFFLGPEYFNDGSVLSSGKYLDKIDWIKIKVVTSQAPAVRTGNLSYGGTCYIRTRVPPCGDPDNPLSLPGEFRVFPFRHFLTLDNGASWEARPAQEDTVKLLLGPLPGEPDPGVPGSAYQNNFLKERSVAATDWVLTISAANLDVNLVEDIEFHVRHLFVSRVLPPCP